MFNLSEKQNTEHKRATSALNWIKHFWTDFYMKKKLKEQRIQLIYIQILKKIWRPIKIRLRCKKRQMSARNKIA